MVVKGSGQTEDKGAVCIVGRVRVPARVLGPATTPTPATLLAEGRPDVHHHLCPSRL